MTERKIPAVVLAASLAMAGCATDQGSNEQAGLVIGGLIGGVLGQGSAAAPAAPPRP